MNLSGKKKKKLKFGYSCETSLKQVTKLSSIYGKNDAVYRI